MKFDKDFVVTLPLGQEKKCRISEVHAGTFAYFGAQINNKIMHDKFGDAVPEIIGGEMEGGELMQFQKEGKIDGVIVIKGVVDYGDDFKGEEWEFTAAMAALTYTRDKLYYYEGIILSTSE